MQNLQSPQIPRFRAFLNDVPSNLVQVAVSLSVQTSDRKLASPLKKPLERGKSCRVSVWGSCKGFQSSKSAKDLKGPSTSNIRIPMTNPSQKQPPWICPQNPPWKTVAFPLGSRIGLAPLKDWDLKQSQQLVHTYRQFPSHVTPTSHLPTTGQVQPHELSFSRHRLLSTSREVRPPRPKLSLDRNANEEFRDPQKRSDPTEPGLLDARGRENDDPSEVNQEKYAERMKS